MTPNSLEDAFLRLSSSRLLITEFLLIDLASSTIEVHLPWIDGSLALFPSPNPEEEREERKWEIVTIERLVFNVTPQGT